MDLRRHFIALAAITAFAGGALTWYHGVLPWIIWLGICFGCGLLCTEEKDDDNV